jgi:YVTN family beta-propeller protein
MLGAAAGAVLSLAAGTPSPALLVVSKAGALEVVDPASRRVVAAVRVGETPHEVAVSPDGKLAFVSNYGSDTPGRSISVIDLAAQKEVRRVDLSPLMKPHGLSFGAGGLYFTAETNQAIGRYDPAAGKIDWLFGTGQERTHMISAADDGNRIITANTGSDSISIFERSGTLTWRETVIPVGKGPEGFDIAPDGKQLWAANSRDGSVSVVNLSTRQFVRAFNVHTKRSNRLKFTPDGRLVLISDLDGGELLVMERETRKELKRMKLGKNPAGILVLPDSSRAYVAVTGDNNIAEINLKTLDLAARIATGPSPDGMAWVK